MKNNAYSAHLSRLVSAGAAVILLLLEGPETIYGITEVGNLVVQQTFTPNDSPVIVTNHTTFADVTLQRGVIVQIDGQFTITVASQLRAVGTKAQPIVFQPTPHNTNGWSGLLFEYSAGTNELDHVFIENAHDSAVRLINTAPIIRNSRFISNRSAKGGAIFADIRNGLKLTIANCTFENNYSDQDGGAVAVTSNGLLDVSSCDFIGNRANWQYATRHTGGGAIALTGNGRFSRSVFRENRAHAYTIYAAAGVYTVGGALSLTGGTNEIVGCDLWDNAVEMTAHVFTPDLSVAYGGAVYLRSGSLVVKNTRFAKNWLKAQNRAILSGSAVYCDSGEVNVLNCTFSYNQGSEAIRNANATLAIANSILYFNNGSGTQLDGTASVSYSNCQNGYPGNGNIDFNPIFTSDYQIIPGSPSVDAGDPRPEFEDTYFPPSLGTLRNDQGFSGGPTAAIWLAENVPFRPELKLLQSTLFEWTDQVGAQLLHAASPEGPWVQFDGSIHSEGARRYVFVNQNGPRRFFKLVNTQASSD